MEWHARYIDITDLVGYFAYVGQLPFVRERGSARMTAHAGDIDVDLDRLRAFTGALRHDLDASLLPGIERAHRELQEEVPFGAAMPGGQTAACREVMTTALQRARQNAVSKLITAQVMTEVIETILAGYAGADGFSARRLAEIHPSPTHGTPVHE